MREMQDVIRRDHRLAMSLAASELFDAGLVGEIVDAAPSLSALRSRGPALGLLERFMGTSLSLQGGPHSNHQERVALRASSVQESQTPARADARSPFVISSIILDGTSSQMEDSIQHSADDVFLAVGRMFDESRGGGVGDELDDISARMGRVEELVRLIESVYEHSGIRPSPASFLTSGSVAPLAAASHASHQSRNAAASAAEAHVLRAHPAVVVPSSPGSHLLTSLSRAVNSRARQRNAASMQEGDPRAEQHGLQQGRARSLSADARMQTRQQLQAISSSGVPRSANLLQGTVTLIVYVYWNDEGSPGGGSSGNLDVDGENDGSDTGSGVRNDSRGRPSTPVLSAWHIKGFEYELTRLQGNASSFEMSGEQVRKLFCFFFTQYVPFLFSFFVFFVEFLFILFAWFFSGQASVGAASGCGCLLHAFHGVHAQRARRKGGRGSQHWHDPD